MQTAISSKPIPTRRHNPCPICGNTTGDCRTAGEIVLCQKSPEGQLPSTAYRFIRPSKDGTWGVYAPGQSEKRSSTEIDAFRRQQIERQQRQIAEHRNGLTVVERDQNIRAIATHVGLKDSHRKMLQGRGLPDPHIDSGLFFSVTNGQPVPWEISMRTPGVSGEGENKHLVSGTNGFACVAFDKNNYAIGYQIRSEDPQANNKYRWAKGHRSSHLQSGELPLTSIRVDNSSKTVFLTEGLLKPFIVASRFGVNTVGAAGGQFLSSKVQFSSHLSATKEIICCPDAGDIINTHTLSRWQTLLNAIGPAYKVWVAWWGQQDKSSPDIDELNDFSDVRYLSRREWDGVVQGVAA